MAKNDTFCECVTTQHRDTQLQTECIGLPMGKYITMAYTVHIRDFDLKGDTFAEVTNIYLVIRCVGIHVKKCDAG